MTPFPILSIGAGTLVNQSECEYRCVLTQGQRLLSKIGIYVAIFLLSYSQAHSDEPDAYKTSPAHREIWRKSQSFNPQHSTDTTPVLIKMGHTSYLIPRNYLTHFDIPTIEVTIPGFEPLTAETKRCFGTIVGGKPRDCASIEFRLFGPSLYTNKEKLEHNMDIFQSKTPRQGPYGYDIYDTGPENARIETYVKEDSGTSVFFHCMIFYNHRERDAVCDDSFTLNNSSNTMRFFSRLDQIGDIPSIEAGIRQLMEGFRIKEVHQ